MKTDEAFAGIYADLRGDILAAAGKPAEAQAPPTSSRWRRSIPSRRTADYVQVKLDALGGAK